MINVRTVVGSEKTSAVASAIAMRMKMMDDATGDYGGPDDADHAFVCVLMMALGMRIGMLRTATVVVVVAASVVVAVTVAVICCV